jgi:hypothetical protein
VVTSVTVAYGTDGSAFGQTVAVATSVTVTVVGAGQVLPAGLNPPGTVTVEVC